MHETFLAQLAAQQDALALLTGDQVAPYCLDQRRRYQGQALAVARPDSVSALQALLALCETHGISIVPQGGNTSLCGAATPDSSGAQIVVSFERMNRILAVDPDNNTITVEAGATLAAVQAAARAANRLFPANWAAFETCQIGGALATNAGGVNVLRYGNMRELTLGLEVVLPDSQVLSSLRGLRKDNTGYDLKQLFIGSEGTLGLITKAVLRLYPLPTAHATALVAVPDPTAAIDLMRGVQAALGDRITSFELISRCCVELVAEQFPDLHQPFASLPEWLVLLELSDGGQSALLRDHLVDTLGQLGIEEAYIAQNERQAAEFWELRESIPEAQRRHGVSIKHDISLPVGDMPAFLAACNADLTAAFADALIVAFGHLGDGNLHYNLFRAERTAKVYEQEHAINEIVYRHVARFNGSISAEHGIGQLKRAALAQYRSPVELAVMRSIKAVFDPQGRLNPGKVI